MDQIVLMSTILLWVIVILNLFLTLAVIRTFNTRTKKNASQSSVGGLEIGKLAPNFVAETLHGQEVTLATYAGRSIVLIFFGTNCPPCRESIPNYEAWGLKAKQSGISFVLVSVDNKQLTQAFVEEFTLGLTILVAPSSNNPFMRDYKIDGTPSYCMLDSNGIVESTGIPNLNVASWKKIINQWSNSKLKSSNLISTKA